MFLRDISFATLMLASASHAVADPLDLLKDAQTIPSHRGGKVVVPASSVAGPEDFGSHAHTNVRFFAAGKPPPIGRP